MKCLRVTFRFARGFETDAHNALLDDFLLHAIEANGLQFGGGGSEGVWDGVAEAAGDIIADVTEVQQQAVETWLRGEPQVLDFVIGALFESPPIGESFVDQLGELVDAVEAGAPDEEVRRLFDQLGE